MNVNIFRYRRPNGAMPPVARLDVSAEGPRTNYNERLVSNLARRLAPHLEGLRDDGKFYSKLEKKLLSVIEMTERRALARFKADVASELSKILELNGEGHPILKKFQSSEPGAYEDFVITIQNARIRYCYFGKKPALSDEQKQALSIMIDEFSQKNHRREGSDGGGVFWRKYQERLTESGREIGGFNAAKLLLKILREDKKAIISGGQKAIIPILVVMAVNESNGALENKKLFSAVKSGDVEGARRIIDQGRASVNTVGSEAGTSLHHAVDEKNLEMARMLISKGADVNAPNKNGITPLLIASCYGDLEMVRLLILNGADFHAANHHDETPLHYAAKSENLELVKFLVEKGSKTDARDENGETPREAAERKGYAEISEFLRKNMS